MLGHGALGSAKKCPLPGVPYSGKKLYFGYHWNRIMSRTFWEIPCPHALGRSRKLGNFEKCLPETIEMEVPG